MGIDWPDLDEAAVQAAMEQDAADAPARHSALVERLRQAFGEAWLAAVHELPWQFQAIALAAGSARIDPLPNPWPSEQEWLARNVPLALESPLFSSGPLNEEPRADAQTVFAQGVLVLRDKGLWPWGLTPHET